MLIDTGKTDTPASMPRAVIWDMDGTLIDSGPMHYAAWHAQLLQENLTLTPELFRETFGLRNDAVLRVFFGTDISPNDIARISDTKEERYRDLLRAQGVEPLLGVRQWLARLRNAGWRQAIASSAPQQNLEVIIEALWIGEYLSAVASGDDIEHGKPDPAIFLLAAQRMEVEPERCVVVEDAPAGVEGARRAGMHAIGVLFSHEQLEADIVVSRLDQLPLDAFERLVPATS